MNYTFNADEVICNGVGGTYYQEAMESKDLILHLVTQVRDHLGEEVIFTMAQQKNKFGELYIGRRFSDPVAVTDRLATGLGAWANTQFNTAQEAAVGIRTFIETLSREDAITLVVEAHRECASADHWYTFEKQW